MEKLMAILGVTNFLVSHVNRPIIKRVQVYVSKNYQVDLSPDQIKGVLQIACLTRDMVDTLQLEMDGSDLVVEDEVPVEEDQIREFILPGNLNIVVLAGGLSNERNLSLKTGYTVSEVLKSRGNRVILLDAFMGVGDREDRIPDAFAQVEKYTLAPRDIPSDVPDLWAVRKRRPDQSPSYFGPNVLQICKQADLIFIALHGANGENGKVQATFDLLGLDYTGNDHFSSAITSNKAAAKQLMMGAGIPVPDGYLIRKSSEIPDPQEMGLTYPVIVKPNNGGIGLGISLAGDKAAYTKAVREAFRWDREILVEEYVAGREFAVGTIDGKALPVLEKLPLQTKDKEKGMQLSGEAANKCPAEIPEDLAKALQEAAETLAEVLGVDAYAKMDFMVRPDLKSFVCLECDSLPQLYPDSHLVLAAKASGRSFGDLCDKIMEMSLVKKR